jgi:phosphomevalonate kinase
MKAVRAPAKAMLAGEYAVLEGGPAAVAAVSCYATATLQQGAAPASPFIVQAMQRSAAALGLDPDAMPVPVVDTSPFQQKGRKLGLGSSAAATVAAVGAIFQGAGQDAGQGAGRDPDAHRAQILEIARAAHDEAQGVRGSGADVLAATFGGVQVVNGPSHNCARALPLPAPLEVRFVATSRSASTAELVTRYRAAGAPAQAAAAELGRCAAAFIQAWQAGDRAALLLAVEAAFAGYEALGQAMDVALITEEHAQISEAARRVGGAAKPSGAGGGDLAVVFLPDEEAAARLAEALPPALSVLPFSISPVGVHGTWRS